MEKEIFLEKDYILETETSIGKVEGKKKLFWIQPPPPPPKKINNSSPNYCPCNFWERQKIGVLHTFFNLFSHGDLYNRPPPQKK